MREYTLTETFVMSRLENSGEPITIRDMVDNGGPLERGALLKNALIDLEKDGLILSRLPMATSPLRLYELVP